MALLRWGSATHEGQMRSQNEDHVHAGEGLFVVADGMGGHLAGEVASEMAVARLRERIPMTADNTLDDLVSAIADANTDIYNGAIDNPDQAGMGTTVTAIAVVSDPHDGEVFAVANVGDSRGYVQRHGRLRQLTIDHSFVQELVAEGAITRDEARTHPRRNIVTRALGIEPYVRVDSWTMPIIRGDRFVLCSDGLVDEITDEAITAVLDAHPDDPDAAAQGLVDAANDAGGRDNITVVVVDVIEGDEPPDPTAEFDVVPSWRDDDLDSTGETEIVADPPDEHDEHDPAGAIARASLYDGGDDVTPVAGAAVPIVEAEPTAAATDDTPPTRKRGGRLARFLLGIGVASVLVLGFSIFAAWARSGYYIDFDADDQVVIYQGRKGGVLWFDPTREALGPVRADLDSAEIDLVEERLDFESLASAERFVAERLTPATIGGTATDDSSTDATSDSSTDASSDSSSDDEVSG